jgi:hypothetical protein
MLFPADEQTARIVAAMAAELPGDAQTAGVGGGAHDG